MTTFQKAVTVVGIPILFLLSVAGIFAISDGFDRQPTNLSELPSWKGTTLISVSNRDELPDSPILHPKTRYVGPDDPRFAAYSFAEPPRRNCITLYDYVEVMLLLPESEAEARRKLREHVDPLINKPFDYLPRPSGVTFDHGHYRCFAGLLPADSAALRRLYLLLTVGDSREPISVRPSQFAVNQREFDELRRIADQSDTTGGWPGDVWLGFAIRRIGQLKDNHSAAMQ